MKKILMTVLLFVVTSDVFAIPTLTEASATGTTVKFATKLSETLPKGYKVKIDLNNGKGLVAMTCSGLTCSLSSNALPKLDLPTYKIGIYDAKGILQGTTMDGSYVIVSTAEINTIPIPSTGYTKISNSGAILPDTAKLGSGSNDWACTKDNKTGLTWEVKTTDLGLRDWNNRYTWYEPDLTKNDGLAGYQNADGHPEICRGSNCDTYAYTNAVNAQSLCGKKDWRMPTTDELKGLLTTTSTFYQPINDNLYIDANYFPNTNSWYWSSSPYLNVSIKAWYANFTYGYSNGDYKYYKNFVRLVR